MARELINRQILLGISGGIAAYKSAELVRRLQDLGADVRVMMTPAAEAFITPLTLQALSGKPVHNTLLDPASEAGMGHIELARWADLIVIAPASADCIARLAQGQGNDLLTTVCLAARCPVAVAPAMNQAMWHKRVTQDNLKLLISRGVRVFGPDSGGQACGDVGFGRMSDPETLAVEVIHCFETGVLTGKQVVITAGPTQEAIDPVRYISNHSSGKMGYAIANAAVDAGAQVTLISGPTALETPEHVHRIDVLSADEMYEVAMTSLTNCDIFIAAAAVADFKPVEVSAQKLKKNSTNASIIIEMIKNPDIVASVAASEFKPFVVGFAAETQKLVEYARGKLINKNLDMMIANDVSQADIGFNSDHNAVVMITAETEETLPKMSKQQLASEIIKRLAIEMTPKN